MRSSMLFAGMALAGLLLCPFGGLALEGGRGGMAGLGPETAVVAYHVADEFTAVSVITADGVQTVSRIPVSRQDLIEKVIAFRKELEAAPEEKTLGVPLSLLEKARDLYELLVGPIEGELVGIKHLIIIPSGPLFYVPFAALLRCPGCSGEDLLYGGEYLIERYSVSYAASLSTLSQVQLGPFGENLVVAGPLPAGYQAQEEARKVASLLPGSTLLTGEAATERAVKDLLRGRPYDVVHITAPWHFNSAVPLCSWLKLAPGKGEDGRLEGGELLGLDLSIGLLVISRPPWELEASFGEGSEVREWVELLHTAGVASAMFPLWNLNNFSAQKLFSSFYQGMRAGLGKGEALRKAQLALLESFRHPYYWAPFVLYGDWKGGIMAEPPDTGKLDYPLYQKLQAWKLRPHPPDELPPVVSVVVVWEHPVTQADLEKLRALSDQVEVVGAFGAFVQVKLPLTLLEPLEALPEVRSITLPPETIEW